MNISQESIEFDRLIDRPLLRSALDEALERRLTLIVAPAGAGKTTLLRQWEASHADRDFVFLDIDVADDDPSHFTRHFVDAFAGVYHNAGRVPPKSISQEEGLGPSLIAALASALDGAPDVVIIVDEVQRFSNVRLVADLGELAERIPHNVHVVLSSRFDPPISLSRYRLDDELLEFRQAQLAFSDTESAELLERIIGHPLALAQVRALRERTEGWAAGLQLAGLNLKHEPDPDAFIAEFGGSDRLVADYLGEEVLAFLPPERRDFLLKVSALDEVCAGLVEAAIGSDDAQVVLEELEHESMFLVPLDTRREWFRFHILFRNLLRSRLSAEDPAGETKVLLAAADWHLARGRAKSAVEYLLRAQAWDQALEVILSNAADVVAKGDMLTVVRWMLQVPEPVRSERISEELLAGVLQAVDDRSIGSETTGRGVSIDVHGSRGQMPPRLAFIAAKVLWRSRPAISMFAARRELDEIESPGEMVAARADVVEDSPAHAGALIAGGRSFFLAGDRDEARRLLKHGLITAGSDGALRISGLSTLALVEAWCGNIELADTLVFDALLTARGAGMLADPAIADAYLASVLTALERGEPALPGTADRTLREVVLLADHKTGTATAPLVRDRMLAVHGRTLRLAGEPAQSLESLGEVSTLAPTVLFERAAASLTMGDSERARDIVQAWDKLVPVPEPLTIVQGRILRAWLAVSDNAQAEATRQLTEAVKVAEIYGLVEVFVRAGPLILQRLTTISGPQAAFSGVIRARAERSAGRQHERELPDPLTDRELEILVYLPTRFSNVELAKRCFVSVNTIKTHMAHIYRKLDVTTRDTAVDRARQLGLL